MTDDEKAQELARKYLPDAIQKVEKYTRLSSVLLEAIRWGRREQERGRPDVVIEIDEDGVVYRPTLTNVGGRLGLKRERG